MFTSSTNHFQIPSNWVYRGEGNCNVVLSLPQEKKILRIRKIKKTTSLLTWLLKWITDIFYWYCGNGLFDELRDLTFYKKIIRPLIGERLVCDAQQVFLSRKQIKILEEKLKQYRPEYRKFKGLQYGRAALFDDYAFLRDNSCPINSSSDTFAVEIKPKQGWVPLGEKNYPKCIFCMKQYMKREKGQIKSLSSYCPLDLFSGNRQKMVRALEALVDSPQNNFQIFKNGHLCYGEKHSKESFRTFIFDFFATRSEPLEILTHEFYLLVIKCLLTNFEGSETNTCDLKLFCEWNKTIEASKTALPRGSVLERILSVQMLDVEGNQYYSKLLGDSKFRDYDYVRKLLTETTKFDRSCLKCLIMMLGRVETGCEINDLSFVPYLVSAIAKDCSLMLTFRKMEDEAWSDYLDSVVSTKYGDFIVSVGVFDLYPKPISTILKHKRRIKKVLDLCSEI